MGDTIKKEFSFEKENTCKQGWVFTISEAPEGKIIDNVEVINREKVTGCQGHPRTIAALLKGRPVKSPEVDALARISCVRDKSCAQAVAECLAKLGA